MTAPYNLLDCADLLTGHTLVRTGQSLLSAKRPVRKGPARTKALTSPLPPLKGGAFFCRLCKVLHEVKRRWVESEAREGVCAASFFVTLPDFIEFVELIDNSPVCS
jgi:hypothetical protein